MEKEQASLELTLKIKIEIADMNGHSESDVLMKFFGMGEFDDHIKDFLEDDHDLDDLVISSVITEAV